MVTLTDIRRPIEAELAEYSRLFDETLQCEDKTINNALSYIRGRKGKMMRPILVLLVAKELGKVPHASYLAAVTLELLHTASLIHDDVVDESKERRGQRSANAVYDNKIAVLLGDYMLSNSLLCAAQTQNLNIVEIISRLGGELSRGEIHQLANTHREDINEEDYYNVIHYKTAALFRACSTLGALSANADATYVEKARKFGEIVGTCFQIRDDIFDYYDDAQIGKPRGNDMAEGKLTLPVIHAILATGNAEMKALALKVRQREATAEDITRLIQFTKDNGGIEYAEQQMQRLKQEASALLSTFQNEDVRQALNDYLDFVIQRTL